MIDVIKPATCWAVPNVYGFMESLADFIQQSFKASPLSSQQTLVVLPTRRSCRHLKDLLLLKSRHHPLIPPPMASFADLKDLPFLHLNCPSSNTWQNLVQLMEILTPLLPPPHTLKTILNYAQTLQPLLEEWTQYQLSMTDLEAIVPHHLAEHLQNNLQLFHAALEQNNQLHVRSLYRQMAYQALLEKCPHLNLLVATEAPQDPATLSFLAACSNRPNTHLFMLGLDADLCGEETPQLQPYHPHYGFCRLLHKADILPPSLKLFNPALKATRHTFFGQIFNKDDLISLKIPATEVAEALDNISLIECPNQHDEASTIAVILREVLETPHKTAALITPDRQLAGMVKAQLRRWEVEIDDSAGEPFFETPVGAFLKLVVECLLTDFEPLPLLSLLKHPYFTFNRSRPELRRLTRLFERTLLRQGQVTIQNLATWQQATDNDNIKMLLKDLADLRDTFAYGDKNLKFSFQELLEKHLQIAIQLATSPEAEGQKTLFKGEIGEGIYKSLQELLQAAPSFSKVSLADYLMVFIQLLHGIRVRRSYGYHPRLFIFDPLQAQLQDFDCVILGGLNAGTWPQQNTIDPWFSQEMRRTSGLPTLAHSNGLEVQYFINLLNAPEVILTRAQKANGALSLPSPWLQRLQTALKAYQADNMLEPAKGWLAWYRQLDKVVMYQPVARPRPQPPLSYRPRELSVTDVERLLEDPYAIYARKILKLKPLAPLEPEASGSLFGTLVHRILDQFYAHVSPAANLLEQIGARTFRPFQELSPAFYGLYWPKFVTIAKWIWTQYAAEKDTIVQSFTEVPGLYQFAALAGPFKLTAIADRIDILQDGSLRIIDYKTGLLPSTRQLSQGGRPQLLLEALIAEKGHFKGIDKHTVSAIEFWQLGRHADGGERLALAHNLDKYIHEMEERLDTLIAFYDHPEGHYQPSWKGNPFCPYSQLARRDEWSKILS